MVIITMIKYKIIIVVIIINNIFIKHTMTSKISFNHIS